MLRPVLQLGNYRWKFAADGIEFGAVIKDETFMSDLVAGRHHIEMRGGIIMTLQLEITEEFNGQAWIVKERVVTQVLKTEAGSVQIEFPSAPPETDDSNGAQ